MKTFTQHMKESTLQALRHAKKAHTGQTRSDKSPYIKHPMRVARLVKQFKTSKNLDKLIQAAYLHDTIEDTDTTHDDLKKMFSGLTASLVKELTSDSEQIAKVGKTAYLADKMKNMTSYALVIKLADRLDNVQDIATAKTPEWRRKYKNETLHILAQLAKDRTLTGTHKRIIIAIRKKLDEVQ